MSNMILVKCNYFPQFRAQRNMDPYPVHLDCERWLYAQIPPSGDFPQHRERRNMDPYPALLGFVSVGYPPSGDPRLGILFEIPL